MVCLSILLAVTQLDNYDMPIKADMHAAALADHYVHTYINTHI